MADETVNWPGASDQRYEYSAYPLGTPFKDIPGNYIFAKLNSSGRWSPVYIGETGSLSDRIPTHEKLPCVRRNGGTHVHAHTSSSNAAIRREEESDLLGNFGTSCND